jgi:hypothetical protein
MANDRYIYTNHDSYGVNGIKGDRFNTVAGWEHGTVGFAGNIYSRLASENGIQPVDPAVTASREPFKVGRFLLKVLRSVPFFDAKVSAAWRYIIEDTATEFSGIQSYQLETYQKTHGAIRQNSTYVGTYKENNGEFTIKVPETAGQLVRKSIDYWHYGMSDPKTGVSHFYGKDFRDLQPNKSMDILYVLLGPTCRPEDIEYAAIFHQCVCTTPKHDHNNAGTLGEAGQGVEHDLTFSGIFDRGPEVDRLAAIIVDREGLYEERAQNALLPAYMYRNYFDTTSAELSPDKLGYTLADRVLDTKNDDSFTTDLSISDTGHYDTNAATIANRADWENMSNNASKIADYALERGYQYDEQKEIKVEVSRAQELDSNSFTEPNKVITSTHNKNARINALTGMGSMQGEYDKAGK